jgi:hypothetical protein
VSPLTAKLVVVGAASVPLDCTVCPPRVMPLVAVSPPLAVRFTWLAEV